MRRFGTICALVLAFLAGVLLHLLYQRWSLTEPVWQNPVSTNQSVSPAGEGRDFHVKFVPLPGTPTADNRAADVATVLARDIGQVRSLAGRKARIRGRIFRVGHSAKSNTYFLDFGPSREALTAVIFASAVELFEKNRQTPRQFENREVEIVGFIKDHPQYGLEVVLEHPEQIRILN
jgi:hypothetical protein